MNEQQHSDIQSLFAHLVSIITMLQNDFKIRNWIFIILYIKKDRWSESTGQ